jgi:uncharacterized membrane protein
MAIDPIPQQGRANESEDVNERSFDRAEDRAVHDRQRIGNRERRRSHDDEDRDRKRIGQRPDCANLVRDAGLVPDYQVRERERRGQQRQRTGLSKELIQAMEIIKAVITLLCGVGLYASLFMLAKTRRAARGEIEGPSVVKTPRAYLFGVPNSLLGALYYPLLGAAIWFAQAPAIEVLLLIASLVAAAASLFLAYSLLFLTRRECPYCWTSHAVNWSLAILCGWLFLPNVLNRGI